MLISFFKKITAAAFLLLSFTAMGTEVYADNRGSIDLNNKAYRLIGNDNVILSFVDNYAYCAVKENVNVSKFNIQGNKINFIPMYQAPLSNDERYRGAEMVCQKILGIVFETEPKQVRIEKDILIIKAKPNYSWDWQLKLIMTSVK